MNHIQIRVEKNRYDVVRVPMLPQVEDLLKAEVRHDLAAKVPARVDRQNLACDVHHHVHATVRAVEKNVSRRRDQTAAHGQSVVG